MAADWRRDLEDLASSLVVALREGLEALLLYGSAARGGQRGDVNLLLLVRDASSAGLRPVAEAMARWVGAGYAPPLVMSLDEWRASADVFPIEIEDMREAHELLRGHDPFDGIATTRENLRAELEREARGKLLHLRTAYAAAAPNGKALSGLVERSSGSVLTLLRAALRLAARPVPANDRSLVSAAATLAGLDPAAFDWVLDRRAAGAASRSPLEPYDARATRYVDAVQAFAAWVDTYTGTVT